MKTEVFRGHLFLDWDDTIAHNIHLFRAAERRNADYLSALFGLPVAAIRRRAAALDVEVSHRMGLVRSSFPTAWVTCYERLCQETGRAVSQDERDKVWATADWAYGQPQDLVEGAAEALQDLRQEGYELCVWTAGDPEVQQRKIDQSGLGELVHQRFIVSRKEARGLANLLAERDRRRCAVVGNSASSDIRPALALDLLALHIPVETWAYDEARLDTAHPKYVRLEAIGAVREVLAERLRDVG